MAFRLTPSELAQREHLIARLIAASDRVTDRVAALNDAVTAAWRAVDHELSEYNRAVAETQAFVSEIYEERCAEFREMSPVWQDGRDGDEAAAWLDQWSLMVDEVDLDAMPLMEMPALTVLADLKDLPT